MRLGPPSTPVMRFLQVLDYMLLRAADEGLLACAQLAADVVIVEGKVGDGGRV